MKSELTDIKVRSLIARNGRQTDFFDPSVPAFGVRVSPKGTKSFFVMYRIRGKQKRLTLGRYPSLSLSEARKEARAALYAVAAGQDPQSKRETNSDAAGGFNNFLEDFLAKYAVPRNRTWQETERILRREFLPLWTTRSLTQITKADVLQILDTIVARGSPQSANAAFAAIRRAFSWAVERGILQTSPCERLQMPSPITERDRVLSPFEIEKIWKAAEEMGFPYGRLIQMLMLSGQRRSEVALMEWNEVDWHAPNWKIPSSKTKNKTEHIVPLTPGMVELLAGLPRHHDRLVFPAKNKGNALSGFSKWKHDLDETSGVSGWVVHDLRRTMASGMAALGVQPHIIERILNHTSGVVSGVAAIYNRHAYLAEMRDALTKWDGHVKALIT